jgi:hypothetical protein
MKKTPVQIAAFIKRHYEPSRLWSRETILAWVRWFQARNFSATLLDERSRIVGVAMARPVEDMPAGDYDYKEGAPGVYIDLIIALTERARNALGVICFNRFPQLEWFAFDRPLDGRERRKIPVSAAQFFMTRKEA